MHPNTFYASLLNRPKRDEVFVIMSFAPEFDRTWTQVIEPAIREDVKLTPNRVDYNRSGESVVHDILDGIAHARLILADITCTIMQNQRGAYWPQRNGNVMWEVGIAHVTRVPDEVVLIRADNEPSIFDLTQFRAFTYDPCKIAQSRAQVANLCKDRLRAFQQFRADYVARFARELSYPAWTLLLRASHGNGVEPPIVRSLEDAVRNLSTLPAINQLLEIGALETAYATVTPEVIKARGNAPYEECMRYQITPLGSAILSLVFNEIGILKPEMIALFEEMQSAAVLTPPSDMPPQA
jgi:hypothetical protein